MTAPRVAIVHLGRTSAMGEGRRVETWRSLFSAAGAIVQEVKVMASERPQPHLTWRDIQDLRRGEIVPEALAWPAGRAAEQLRASGAHITVFITGRTYRPWLADAGGVPVLDLVDELSRSYRQRSAISTNPIRGAALQLLACAHSRFERRGPAGVLRVAAGFSDAERLGAAWVPVLAPVLETEAAPTRLADLLFLGNLAYPPNVHAVRALDRWWPSLPTGTTMVLAGRAPTSEVRSIANRRGWAILPDFGCLQDLRGVASLAVVPLRHTAGIQMKVLDAAALGIAQVVTPAALEGMAPGFPVRVAGLGQQFSDAVAELLHDPRSRVAMALAATEHVTEHYSVTAWLPWIERLLSESLRR